MRRAIIVLVFAVLGLCSRAATGDGVPRQTGRLTSTQLIKTERIQRSGAPDGLAFYFLVTPTGEAFGQFSIRETRDLLLGGQSYRQKTQAELGRRFEPETRIDDPAKFISAHPEFRTAMPRTEKGALVVSIAIPGAKLPDGAAVTVALEIGYDQQLEKFSFRVPVPAR
jgi:hypothetical protein